MKNDGLSGQLKSFSLFFFLTHKNSTSRTPRCQRRWRNQHGRFHYLNVIKYTEGKKLLFGVTARLSLQLPPAPHNPTFNTPTPPTHVRRRDVRMDLNIDPSCWSRFCTRNVHRWLVWSSLLVTPRRSQEPNKGGPCLPLQTRQICWHGLNLKSFFFPFFFHSPSKVRPSACPAERRLPHFLRTMVQTWG